MCLYSSTLSAIFEFITELSIQIIVSWVGQLFDVASSEELVITIHRLEEYFEDGVTKFFRNVGIHLPNYKMSLPKRPKSR
jgi:hypothetical protein